MANQWIQKQLEQLLFDFDQADKDKSGSLTFPEVFSVLKSQGFKGSLTEIKGIFQDIDVNEHYSVSRDEFNAAMKKLPKLGIRDFYLRRMFKAMDKDGSGSLTRDEIRGSVAKEGTGLNILDETAAQLMDALCKDEDGKLDYEEFLLVFREKTEIGELRKIFSQLDKDGSGSLTKDEIIKQLNENEELQLSKRRLIEQLQHLKTDADGKISSEEFIKVWQEGRV